MYVCTSRDESKDTYNSKAKGGWTPDLPCERITGPHNLSLCLYLSLQRYIDIIKVLKYIDLKLSDFNSNLFTHLSLHVQCTLNPHCW